MSSDLLEVVQIELPADLVLVVRAADSMLVLDHEVEVDS